MALPALIQGGVLPPGIHDCSLREVHSLFGKNPERSRLLERFEAFLERLAETTSVPVSIYLDGSFVTDWESCCDIDVIIEARDFQGGNINEIRLLSDPQVRREFIEDFRVVLHIVVPGLFSRDYRSWFQNVKTEDSWRFGMEPSRLKKGIVRLAL
jgi:hypothetical protein